MKVIIKTSVLIAVFTLFFSCTTQIPLSSVRPIDNQTYKVEYLFEHEGCKVYRFLDGGNYVYYTNRNSDVTSIENDSTQTRVVNMVRNKVLK